MKHIDYQGLTQAALKGVVRATLAQASKLDRLPGDHHFYITFRTRTPGVRMADHLKDRFPDEMTIVVQHQYWDFRVFDDRFEITLKFSGDPQELRVPFAALTRFYDPSVSFGLQFEISGEPVEPIGPVSDTAPATDAAAGAKVAASGEATVVSLDSFRRK
jgi:hypothetical protein